MELVIRRRESTRRRMMLVVFVMFKSSGPRLLEELYQRLECSRRRILDS